MNVYVVEYLLYDIVEILVGNISRGNEEVI